MQEWKTQGNRITATAGLAVMSLLTIGAIGCGQPPSRLNAPPQGHTNRPHELQEDFVYMNDNAMLADMSMSSIHFVPHSPELNATGVRRLKRYAPLIKTYGGTLHYDGVDDPEELAQDRVNQISAFLLAAGVPREHLTVEPGLAGGAGMNAKEARDIREATNFSKKSSDQAGGNVLPTPGMPAPAASAAK